MIYDFFLMFYHPFYDLSNYTFSLEPTYNCCTFKNIIRILFSECSHPRYFWRTTGTRLISENSEISNDTSLTECKKKCGVKVNCLAFNFNVNSLQCEVLSSSNFSINVERRSDWDYYGADLC